jgi:hypothetical protein
MGEVTTIQLDKSIVKNLKEMKDYPRQTYNEIITLAIKALERMRNMNQYDEFLHKVQQEKMKELWDNKEDEVWENV